mmetsp:Transcript_26245/g.75149  ORF Transcript_26245/g.75149 Transcript_26245/m.75149 type:complete len:313 (-) Transcript_26245:138-1076(-)
MPPSCGATCSSEPSACSTSCSLPHTAQCVSPPSALQGLCHGLPQDQHALAPPCMDSSGVLVLCPSKPRWASSRCSGVSPPRQSRGADALAHLVELLAVNLRSCTTCSPRCRRGSCGRASPMTQTTVTSSSTASGFLRSELSSQTSTAPARPRCAGLTALPRCASQLSWISSFSSHSLSGLHRGNRPLLLASVPTAVKQRARHLGLDGASATRPACVGTPLASFRNRHSLSCWTFMFSAAAPTCSARVFVRLFSTFARSPPYFILCQPCCKMISLSCSKANADLLRNVAELLLDAMVPPTLLASRRSSPQHPR